MGSTCLRLPFSVAINTRCTMSQSIDATMEVTARPASSSSILQSPSSVVEARTVSPQPAVVPEKPMEVAVLRRTCKCHATCSCRNPLQFPRRVGSLPPVTALLRLYEAIKTSSAFANCVFTSAEAAVLIGSAPAQLAAGPLHRGLATPVYVADLVLCKGLDVLERALPCLKQEPSKTFKNAAICACGVPAAVCYMCSKLVCKGMRTCLCDVPAVACGLPALACLSAMEVCLCTLPHSVCYLPAAVASTAASGVVRDAEEVLKDVNAASDVFAKQWKGSPKGCDLK